MRGWLVSQRLPDLFLSVITILEIEIGIGRLEGRGPDQARRLRAWLSDEVLDAFRGRVLAIDLVVVQEAARLHVPDPRPERDALIAATAVAHDLTVATRNVSDFSDFSGVDVPVVNPLEHEAG